MITPRSAHSLLVCLSIHNEGYLWFRLLLKLLYKPSVARELAAMTVVSKAALKGEDGASDGISSSLHVHPLRLLCPASVKGQARGRRRRDSSEEPQQQQTKPKPIGDDRAHRIRSIQ